MMKYSFEDTANVEYEDGAFYADSNKKLAEAWNHFHSSVDNYEDYQVMSALTAMFTNVSARKQQVVREIDTYKDHYLVDVMVTQLVEDALAPEIRTGDVLAVKSTKKNKELQKELDYLDTLINFNQLAKDIAPEAILYGEHFLRTDLDVSKGIVGIYDDVEYGTVVPLTKGGRIVNYLVSTCGRLFKAHRSAYVGFIMDGHRYRIDMKDAFNCDLNDTKKNNKILNDIPRFIRVGKSLIYNILPKLKELDLLEKLIPSTKLSKLSGGNIVGVNLNEKTEMKEAVKTVRQLENLINKRVSVDTDLQDLTVEKLLNTAGKVKVIPLFGEKGTLERLDYKSDEPDDLTQSAEDLRRLITSSVGHIYELLFGGDTPDKQEQLRRYARYLRKLKNIQRCITNGIKQIIYIHLDNKDIEYNKKEDISVEFLNTLVEVDNLDKLEHASLTINALQDMHDYVVNLIDEESPIRDAVKPKVYADYVSKHLSTIGMGELIDPKKVKDLDLGTEDDADVDAEEGTPTFDLDTLKATLEEYKSKIETLENSLKVKDTDNEQNI